MKPGEKKNFIYIPLFDFIEAGETKEETLKRIAQAEVKREIQRKKTFKRLQKQFPDCDIIPDLGGMFNIIPRKGEEN